MDNTKKDNQFPEAGAVAFFGYKRVDGFEISLTLKDETGDKLLLRLEGAITKVKKDGGTPLPLRNGSAFTKPAKPPREYLSDRVCPLDKGKLYYQDTKKGKVTKCENSRYDFATRTASGCKYIEFPKPDNSISKQEEDFNSST